MIPTETLQIAKAVAHFRNFSLAAKHLNKVPSAISYTIKKLENRLGVQLFIRDRKQVTLTAAGEHFIKHTDSVLKSLEALATTTRQAASAWEPTLDIAIANTVNPSRIYDLISDLLAVRPELELKISTEVHNGNWDALYHGRCQLVIGAPATISETIQQSHRFAWRSMGRLYWDFVIAPDHPLAAIDCALATDRVKDYRSICIQDTSHIFNKGYKWLLDKQVPLVVPCFNTAIECLRKGLGVAVLPRHFVQKYIESGTLIKKNVLTLPSADEAFLAWNKNNMGNGMNWVINWLGSKERLNQNWLQQDDSAPLKDDTHPAC